MSGSLAYSLQYFPVDDSTSILAPLNKNRIRKGGAENVNSSKKFFCFTVVKFHLCKNVSLADTRKGRWKTKMTTATSWQLEGLTQRQAELPKPASVLSDSQYKYLKLISEWQPTSFLVTKLNWRRETISKNTQSARHNSVYSIALTPHYNLWSRGY